MKKIILPLSIALAQMLAVSSFAQTGVGENSAPAVAPRAAPATAAEKAAAREKRKIEGTAAAKDITPTEGDDKSEGPVRKFTKAERAEARAKRKAATAEAIKKGEIQSGEKY